MDLYFRDLNFNITNLIDYAEAILWTRKYYEPGDFTIVLPVSAPKMSLGDYVTRKDDESIGIIRRISYTDKNVTISGKMFEDILSKRVDFPPRKYWSDNPTSWTWKLEDILRHIVTYNAIENTGYGDRKFPGLVLGDVKGYTNPCELDTEGLPVSELLHKVCSNFGIGWKITRQGSSFVFDLYKGTNRSYTQDVNPHVVFSDEFDNMIDPRYVISDEILGNVGCVYSGNCGQGQEPGIFIYNNNISGFDRREIYVDATQITDNNPDGSRIPYSEFTAMMLRLAANELVGITNIFDAEITASVGYKYKQDYFVGDIVSIKNSKWDVSTNTRILAVTESDGVDGYSVVPTFGE
jgi:hypothetical protein